MHICNTAGLHGLWDWTFDPKTTCQAPALPVNQTGLKVLLYGPQKTGTKSMTKGLVKAGLPMTYHSEEFLFNVWTGISDAFWARPENGGTEWPNIGPPAFKGVPWNDTDSDLKVLHGTPREELAAAISRCRIDAMAIDGIEALFWPLYELSPGVKVISLDWRTWEQWEKSHLAFDWQLSLAIYLYGLLVAPLHLFPWSAAVVPLLEYFSDGAINKFLSTGSPPFTQEGSIPVVWFRYALVNRRWLTQMSGGLPRVPANKSEFEEGFAAVKRAVPPENHFVWNMKKHTMADLCAFLGSDAPGCKDPGPLPKGINILYIEREQWPITLTLGVVWMVLQVVTWKIVCAIMSVLTWPFWKILDCFCRGSREKKE